MKLSFLWLIASVTVSALLTTASADTQSTELTPAVKSQSKHHTLHECVTPSGLKFYSNQPCGKIIEGSH